MPSVELLRIADAVIDSVNQDTRTAPDELLRKLHCILPENLILAALDLIDCECVVKYTPLHGYPQYEVYGSTATYSVFLDMALAPIPFFCTCPTFSYAVLGSRSHIMCKHILATRLANKMSLFIERPMTRDDFQSMMVRQFSDTKPPMLVDDPSRADDSSQLPEHDADLL